MKEKILIAEDQFLDANQLRMMLLKAGYQVCGIPHSVPQAIELMKTVKPDIVLLNIFLKGKLTVTDLARQLSIENIPFVYLSDNANEEVLNAAKTTQPYGFLVKPFREKDLLVTLEIARYRHEQSTEANARKEQVLIDKLASAVNEKGSWEQKMLLICTLLKQHISFDYITAGFNTVRHISDKSVSFLRIGYEEYQTIGPRELQMIAGLNSGELIELVQNTLYENMPAIVAGEMFEQFCSKPTLDKLFSGLFQIKSYIYFPLHLANGKVFIFCFYCKRPDTYTTAHMGLMNRLHKFLSGLIDKMLELPSPKGQTAINNTTPVAEARTEFSVPKGFEGIIGKSRLLQNVFDLVEQVAYSDTSVLILGESGTGKERIADCIHRLSPRANKTFVKVNCAALPATLIESELFGHEKGAYTGAVEKRIGKFEKADKGTIFLDEIGEMPLDLQVKLLRVLQEKYIERIGSTDITKIDVRIIAATNRNLEKEVAEGRFRLDLYYRLNVFPVNMPALRERPEDIPELAGHFIQLYNRKTGRKITGIADRALKIMESYHWPGNIRQLENLIERAVLLTRGNIIEEIAIPGNQKPTNTGSPDMPHVKTIDENERDHIIAVLKKCHGRVSGPGGAAELLNVPASTLRSKMQKLGIRKEDHEINN